MSDTNYHHACTCTTGIDLASDHNDPNCPIHGTQPETTLTVYPTEDTPIPQGGYAHAEETKSLDATKSFTPKWLKRMPKKWRKVKGEWIAWQHPSPTKDPAMTNKQRFHANPKRRDKVTDLTTEGLSQDTVTPSRPGEHKK